MAVMERWSPHGEPEQTPALIVVHAIAEYLPREAVVWTLRHRGQPIPDDLPDPVDCVTWLELDGTSAHFFVAPDGALTRTRRDDQGAWHARGFNKNSLGVEIMVPGTLDYGSFIERIAEPGWCTEAAYQSAAWVVRNWRIFHRITRVERHSDVDPARKKDPGEGFPWTKFLADAAPTIEDIK